MDTPEGGFDAMLQAAVCQVNTEVQTPDGQSMLPGWPQRLGWSGTLQGEALNSHLKWKSNVYHLKIHYSITQIESFNC